VATLESLSRWYVYELVDGRSGDVFYVGKGTGDRMHAHEKQAPKTPHSKKSARILSIQSSGSSVVKRQVACFWDEQAAYDFETDHIEWFGLQNLTNVLPGGQTAWTRRVAERAKRKPSKAINPVDIVISIAGHVAYWLLVTNGGKRKARLVFEGGDPEMARIRTEIAEAAFNRLLPDLWARATGCVADLPRLIQAFRKYGIELTKESESKEDGSRQVAYG
jgi:hypothetical protein